MEKITRPSPNLGLRKVTPKKTSPKTRKTDLVNDRVAIFFPKEIPIKMIMRRINKKSGLMAPELLLGVSFI